MVCRLIPATRATSDRVTADQSRVNSRSRIASRTESRSRTRDASAYGIRFTGATIAVWAPESVLPGLFTALMPITAPLLLIATLCIVAGGHERAISTISKSAFAAPQSGQLQSSAMSSHRVPGAMPSSGQPLASSYSNPHCTQMKSLNGAWFIGSLLSNYAVEIDLLAHRTIGAAPVVGNVIEGCARPKAFPRSAFRLIVGVVAAGAAVHGHARISGAP